MKVITVVILALLGLSNALPSREVPKESIASQQDSRFIGDLIVGIIEMIVQNVPDPWVEERLDLNVGLPVPVLFNVDFHAKDLNLGGLSDILITRMDYGIFSQRLDMDLYLPRIAISVEDLGVDVTILGFETGVAANVNLVITQPRVSGMIQFNIGIITGVFVRETKLAFSLGDLEFAGRVEAFGFDFTSTVKEVVNVFIPQRLRELESDVNELVNIIAKDIFETILN